MTQPTFEIHGHCDPVFEGVADILRANLANGDDCGASVAITVEGETVVDLWGGWRDHQHSGPWERDSITNVWSSTKGMAATAAHVAADQGFLDFDAPVTQYWPEFGAAGKESVLVRHLFSHTVGLLDIDGDHPDGIALNWDEMCRRLAATAPSWEPGTDYAYHAVTYGWLVGEVTRRAVGAASFGQYFRDVVAGPLGADFWIGLPDTEHARVAPVFREGAIGQSIVPAQPMVTADGAPSGSRAALLASEQYSADPNTAEWRRAEMPAMNGHGNARALARVYGALANGGEFEGKRIMSPDAVERAQQVQFSGPDRFSGVPAIRTLGFTKPALVEDSRPPEAFGHSGMGGSMGFADPVRRLSFGYAMNQLAASGRGSGAVDLRGQALSRAAYAALGL